MRIDINIPSTSNTNSYEVDVPGWTTDWINQPFTVNFTNANSSSCTLNVNGSGDYNLLYNQAALLSGNILANTIATIVFDGTNFNIITPLPFTVSGNPMITTIGNSINIDTSYPGSYNNVGTPFLEANIQAALNALGKPVVIDSIGGITTPGTYPLPSGGNAASFFQGIILTRDAAGVTRIANADSQISGTVLLVSAIVGVTPLDFFVQYKPL